MKRKSTTEKARDLRQSSTDAERLLWKHLRAKGLEGLKFRRQEPIGNYIVDFVCFNRGLVVEVDGGQHVREKPRTTKERDGCRTRDSRFCVSGITMS